MMVTRQTLEILAKHLNKITDGQITVLIDDAPDGRGYRVATAQNPTGRQMVWHSAKRYEARRAVVFILGALGTYTHGAEEPPFLRDLRQYLAWRPEMAEVLRMGQEDGRHGRQPGHKERACIAASDPKALKPHQPHSYRHYRVTYQCPGWSAITSHQKDKSMANIEAACRAFGVAERVPSVDELDLASARAALVAEWDDTVTGYAYVTEGMAWEVKRYALAADVALPADMDDMGAVRAYVDAARTV